MVPGAMARKIADPTSDRSFFIGGSFSGAPGETRTPANPLRRRVLYPTELRAQAYVFLHVIENLALFEVNELGCETLISAH